MKLEYIRNGDYYIPNLTIQKEERSIGKWGRMHREFLREHHPIQFSQLVLSDTLFSYLADLNEQALSNAPFSRSRSAAVCCLTLFAAVCCYQLL